MSTETDSNKVWWKRVPYVLLTIIATVVFENPIRSLVDFLGGVVLKISTLGIQSFQDDLYLHIARGYYERISAEVLALLVALILSFVFFSIFRVLRKDGDGLSRTSQWLLKYKSTVKTVFVVYSVFVIVFFSITTVRLVFINESISYFEQLVKICAPYLSAQEEEVFYSRFAQIKNKSDYESLTVQLEKIISIEKLTKPPMPSVPAVWKPSGLFR